MAVRAACEADVRAEGAADDAAGDAGAVFVGAGVGACRRVAWLPDDFGGDGGTSSRSKLKASKAGGGDSGVVLRMACCLAERRGDVDVRAGWAASACGG